MIPFTCLTAFLFAGLTTNAAEAGKNETRLEGRLSGSIAEPLASGKAKFEKRAKRIRFSVQAEDLMFASSISVSVNGVTVGTAAVKLGFADLNLNGSSIPAMQAGDTVKVFDETGTLVLSGTLSGK